MRFSSLLGLLGTLLSASVTTRRIRWKEVIPIVVGEDGKVVPPAREKGYAILFLWMMRSIDSLHPVLAASWRSTGWCARFFPFSLMSSPEIDAQ